MNPDKKKNIEVVNDDVEELLMAAEDALLLKLNTNAHTVHGISSDLLSNSSLRTNGQANMKPEKKNKNTEVVNDEVEELLRAAEDAALLKLNANSHTVHSSSSVLHRDLHERFRALRSGSKNTKTPDLLTKNAPPPSQEAAKGEEDQGEDDLFSRFAALKASVPKPSSSTIFPSSIDIDTSCSSLGNASKLLGGVDNIDDEDDDEVEKVIRWAKDAARLDPSPSSVEDDDTKDDDSYGSCEVSDEDEDRQGKNRKGRQK